jgi:hypothetical protein
VAKILQHQIIEEALHLIAEEEHWTRCSMARNSEGDPCSVWDPAAVRFCAVGALWRAANELMGDLEPFELVETIAKRVVEINGRTDCLQTRNDLEGHSSVVQMFRTALAA